MFTAYKMEKLIEIKEFYSAFIRRCNDKYRFPGEMHDFWEFVCIISGSAEASANDKIIRLEKGQIIFHKPLEFHNLRACSGSDLTALIVSFSAGGSLIDSFGEKSITLSGEQLAGLSEIVKIIDLPHNLQGDDSLLTEALEKFKSNPRQGQKFKNMIENFIISLSEEPEDSRVPLYNVETLIYKNAVDILNKSKYSSVSIREVAENCNVSTAYLKKIFSKYAGIGIHKYFLQLKLAVAKQMLDKGFSSADIAEKLSFCSQNYFSVVFKREEGISVTQYKNSKKGV